uniref:Ubiquinone/menaquinone biosynthesis C-methylase UbiE n=1 Tax=Candidatus Kentrum sp. UNK TaxID=2126344 RepID=A0A451AES4_9GAMM|nr:MAG: Ubiquinone/menaquinone biosynthesis C-methylase UbiE [Candidatus Kentron sp. UNK]VFK71135.1 MAG: Ubiquinone/menaquinone biosynthesis C-methylase UbiE [Candidatus Kentron sp. UNK]
MAAYDSIAEQYGKFIQRPHSIYMNAYTLFRLIGDVTDKSILDLACGDGFYTRALKQRGAAYVLGVDISEKMIALARQEEKREPLGIEYVICDVLELGKTGDFDLVVAAFLLNYAQTKEQLLQMCHTIYDNLKMGSRFVKTSVDFEKVSNSSDISGPFQEGTAVTFTFTIEGKQLALPDSYYFSKATYAWTFQQAGFKEVHWHEPMVSPEGIQELGQDFCQDMLDDSTSLFIECVK